MDIITYHASDMDILPSDVFLKSSVQIVHSRIRHTGSKRIPATAADWRTLFGNSCTPVRRYNKKCTLVGINILPVFLTFVFIYAILSIPLLRNYMSSSSLRIMDFFEEPSFERSLHAYIFPESDVFSVQEAETVLQDYVPQVTFRNYTVRKGETISGIAARAGLRNIGTLLSINAIDNARRISAGQILRIPSTDGVFYTVKKDETLAGIAAVYKVSVTALLDANDLTDSSLNIGQQLFIPGASLSSFELRKAIGELFIYPIKGRLTSPFGYRQDPFTGVKSFHSGIDLAAPAGTPVQATLDGKVAEAGYNRIFGNYIIITHDRGYQSLYGHLHSIHVKRGQYVTQGTIIGRVGSTGRSTGAHLHLSIYKHGKVINPFSVL